MIATALNSHSVPLNEQQNVDNRRRRFGSGRFVESNFTYNQANQYSDYFQAKKHNDFDQLNANPPNRGGRDGYWFHRDNDHTKSDAHEEEPEWVSCGPTSKHDVIELHGFDGASHENVSMNDGKKKDSDGKSIHSSPSHTNASPPARSTPAKWKKDADEPAKEDEYFNFEDFLKLELPHAGHISKENDLVAGSGNGNGESRFQRWFRRDSPPQKSSRVQNSCTSEHFFEMMQKKKLPAISNLVSTSTKFRSVEELEAGIAQRKPQPNTPVNEFETFRKLLNQMSNQNNDHNRGNPINIYELINRNSQELLQYQIAQQLVLKRPDAQMLLQRLTNGEINQLHLLAMLCNVNTTQYDRDTLIAVINVCNESQRIMQQNQLRAHQLRQGHGRTPTSQELRYHTQAIMQGAMMKKQFEDQFRKVQTGKMNTFGQNNRMNQRVSFISNQLFRYSFHVNLFSVKVV